MMVRLFHAYFPTRTLLLAATEALLILLALLAAACAWFGRDAELALIYENGFLKIAVAAIVCMICMYYYDLYDSAVLGNPREMLGRLVQVLGTTCVLLAFLYYADPAFQLGRGIFLVGILLTGISLLVWRKLFLLLSRSSRLADRTIFLGEGPLAPLLVAEFEKRPELGVRVLGFVAHSSKQATASSRLACLGTVEEMPALVESNGIRRVVVTMEDRRGRMPLEMLLELKVRGVRVEDAADAYESVTGKVPLHSLRLGWLLFSGRSTVSRAMLLFKRISSVVFSLLGLLLLLPLMVLIVLAIRLDSPGPAIFRQPRMGKDKKTFTLYKFRTMWDGTDRDGKHAPVREKDARVTRVGRWLRRTRLDELPQLYNILRGDMYFVGPRPFVPDQEEELIAKIPFYSQRLAVRPGATGWAQIHRGYCASLEDNIEKLAYDLFYIKNMSVGLDLLILFQTVKILLLGRGGR